MWGGVSVARHRPGESLPRLGTHTWYLHSHIVSRDQREDAVNEPLCVISATCDSLCGRATTGNEHVGWAVHGPSWGSEPCIERRRAVRGLRQDAHHKLGLQGDKWVGDWQVGACREAKEEGSCGRGGGSEARRVVVQLLRAGTLI